MGNLGQSHFKFAFRITNVSWWKYNHQPSEFGRSYLEKLIET